MVLMTTPICLAKMAVSVQNCVNFQNAPKAQTSTGRYHRYIPQVPQEFDCRVKSPVTKAQLYKDLVIRDEEFKTNYFGDYPTKIVLSNQCVRPPVWKGVEYTRTVEEKLRSDPPAPIAFRLSEMKDSHRIIYIKPQYDEVRAPCNLAKCHVVKLGSEQQPGIQANFRSFWKWNDPYLTNYKSDYVPYDMSNVLSEKTLTFQNRRDFNIDVSSGNKTMFDKQVFKNVLPMRLLTRAQDRVPNFGMQSEYQDQYLNQTFSYLYPYLEDRCTIFDDSLPPASRWQSLAPPGMYCSEYCNIGGLPVRRTVDVAAAPREIKRTEGCCS